MMGENNCVAIVSGGSDGLGIRLFERRDLFYDDSPFGNRYGTSKYGSRIGYRHVGEFMEVHLPGAYSFYTIVDKLKEVVSNHLGCPVNDVRVERVQRMWSTSYWDIRW